MHRASVPDGGTTHFAEHVAGGRYDPAVITQEALLGVRVIGAIVGAAAFVMLFVVVGFLKLPIPLNFAMPLIGALLGWYLPGMVVAARGARRS